MGNSSGGVPAWVVSGVICLLLSIGGTLMYMQFMGYKTGLTIYEIQEESAKNRGGSPSGTPNMQSYKQLTAPKGKSAKSGVAERPAKYVVTLVEQLDSLTAEPAKLQLTAEQRTIISSALQKLEGPELLEDSVAQEQVMAIVKTLEGNYKVLEEAGFKWPATAEVQPAAAPKNPFKEGEGAKHLKALLDRLAKAA